MISSQVSQNVQEAARILKHVVALGLCQQMQQAGATDAQIAAAPADFHRALDDVTALEYLELAIPYVVQRILEHYRPGQAYCLEGSHSPSAHVKRRCLRSASRCSMRAGYSVHRSPDSSSRDSQARRQNAAAFTVSRTNFTLC